MSTALLALDDAAARDPALVGAKAAGLSSAADAGLPVLPGWVLPLEASAPAIAVGARALARAGPPGAYLAVIEADLPAPLGDALVRLERDDHPFVVRSSTERDGDGRWSGAFGSYLGVDAGDLPTAIKGCWASAFSGDARGRCGELDVSVDTLRVGVLIQPFLGLEVGGTARLRPDGRVQVAAAAGGPAGVVSGRPGGHDVSVGADGEVTDERSLGGMTEAVRVAADLARRAAVALDADVIEWGAVDGDVHLLQIGPVRRDGRAPDDAPAVTPRSRQRASGVAVPVGVERLARLVTAFSGPVADELVFPWALGGEVASLAEGGDVPIESGNPATIVAEARALADAATADVWQVPAEIARRRAEDVARLLLRGRWTDALGAMDGLSEPDPWICRRIVALVRATGELLAGSGLLPEPSLVWRLTGSELDRAILGRRPALRHGPGRWEHFVAEVVLGRGHHVRGAPVSPGTGAGPLHHLSDLRSLGRPGPRDVLAAPLPLPHLAPLLWHCSAVVIAGGTSGAHLFEVARSLGVPAVIGADVGASGAGSLVAVDGHTGLVSILRAPLGAGPAATGVVSVTGMRG
jgi:hypothetical protein